MPWRLFYLTRAFAFVLVCGCVASQTFGGTIDFSGLSGTDLCDGNGQTFDWAHGSAGGTVTLFADWDDLPDQNGPIRTVTQGPTSLANPFVGTLTLSFSQPVQVSLLATFPSLLNDGLEGGRFERVTFSASGGATFSPAAETTAIYSGGGSSQITADDEYSPTTTTSNWGFVGDGLASSYTFVYTSSHIGLSETFNVMVTAVPEPSTLLLLGSGVFCFVALARRRRPRG